MDHTASQWTTLHPSQWTTLHASGPHCMPVNHTASQWTKLHPSEPVHCSEPYCITLRTCTIVTKVHSVNHNGMDCCTILSRCSCSAPIIHLRALRLGFLSPRISESLLFHLLIHFPIPHLALLPLLLLLLLLLVTTLNPIPPSSYLVIRLSLG